MSSEIAEQQEGMMKKDDERCPDWQIMHFYPRALDTCCSVLEMYCSVNDAKRQTLFSKIAPRVADI